MVKLFFNADWANQADETGLNILLLRSALDPLNSPNPRSRNRGHLQLCLSRRIVESLFYELGGTEQWIVRSVFIRQIRQIRVQEKA